MSSAVSSSLRPHYSVWVSDGPIYCHNYGEVKAVLESAHQHGEPVFRVTGWFLGDLQGAVAQFPLDITVLTDTDDDLPF